MENRHKPKRKTKLARRQEETILQKIHLHAAGIDIGSKTHFVAVPTDRDPSPVRSFGTFTGDLQRLADWLSACRIETVAMESTGVYWIPLFQILEARGFQVLLVNARHVKNLPGRKTDVVDCQWLQQLHTFGLLRGSFRPADAICVLRSYLRYRDSLVRDAHTQIHRMQKALQQMNVQLHHVLSDITGTSGMALTPMPPCSQESTSERTAADSEGSPCTHQTQMGVSSTITRQPPNRHPPRAHWVPEA